MSSRIGKFLARWHLAIAMTSFTLCPVLFYILGETKNKTTSSTIFFTEHANEFICVMDAMKIILFSANKSFGF